MPQDIDLFNSCHQDGLDGDYSLETQTMVKKTTLLATGGHCCSMGSHFHMVELIVFQEWAIS